MKFLLPTTLLLSPLVASATVLDNSVLAPELVLEAQRELQLLGLDLPLPGVISFLFDECADEIQAIKDAFPDFGEIRLAAQDLIQCAKDAAVDIVEPCLANFPSVLATFECAVDLLFNPELTQNIVLNSLFSRADSIKEFILAQDGVEDVLDEKVMDEASCLATFGNAEAPNFVGCLALLDITGDLAALAGNLNQGFAALRSCSKFREVFSLQANNAQNPVGLDDNVVEETTEDLAGFYANFEQCDELDNGAVKASLEARFGAASDAATIHQAGVALAAAAAAVYMNN